MDVTIIVALISALATIIASSTTFIFSNVLSGLFRPQGGRKTPPAGDSLPKICQDSRQDSLAGDWKGTVRRKESLGEPLEMHFIASFKSTDSSNPTMPGEGKLTYKDKGRTITKHLFIQGEFVYERFLRLRYELKDQPGAIQFGHVILQLSSDGTTLDGKFLGFSAINGGIAEGTVHTERDAS